MTGDGYDRMIEAMLRELREDLDQTRSKVENLEKWRNWVLGIVAGVGLMTGAFAKQVANIIQHL